MHQNLYTVVMRNSKSNRRLPAAGPTPVGQRLRASTIHGRRFDGPDASEWDENEEES
jgi:chorismate-pyruvate lyase